MSIKIIFLVFGLCAGILSSCSPAASHDSLEVTNVRYDTSDTPRCVGEVRNISSQTFNRLQVQVEFQNSEGNRVRTRTESVTQSSFAPGTSGNFSVPYSKGSNDPPIVNCRIVEFRSWDGGVLLHREKTAVTLGP